MYQSLSVFALILDAFQNSKSAPEIVNPLLLGNYELNIVKLCTQWLDQYQCQNCDVSWISQVGIGGSVGLDKCPPNNAP